MKCFPGDQTEFKGNTITNRQPVKIAMRSGSVVTFYGWQYSVWYYDGRPIQRCKLPPDRSFHGHGLLAGVC